jgi:DNA-binding MarR family transcriptional regulator
MLALTAGEVLALSALRGNHPMTSLELSHALSDLGMHSADAEATVLSLAGHGLAERTPAASLGKYRITAAGRAWLAAYAPPGPGGA